MSGPWCESVVTDFGEVAPPFSVCFPSGQQFALENVFQFHICLCHDATKSKFQAVVEFHSQIEVL